MNKKMIALILSVLILTCIVAAVHLGNQETITCMVIKTKDDEIPVAYEELCSCEFSGSLINGKGEISEHSYTGVLLKDLLNQKGIIISAGTNIAIRSVDHYTAQFTSEEVNDDGTVYIAVAVDGAQIVGIDAETGGMQVVVFGDENSRRCVRNALIIEIESP